MSEHTIIPSAQAPLVLVRAKEAYRLWHIRLADLNRVDRQTVGTTIDTHFISLLEYLFRASFAGDKFEKLNLLSQAIGKTDLLKFFLQLAWEQQVIDHKQYSALLLALDEIGRMLGGWKKVVQEKTPTR